ncbi:MAG: leucine-rich repeat domain-containing protein [Tannerellaceae bacterium]|jgi:hypothetical protein|nr:leucine-rich repeat domain-containing protein [Tannerellaceae bacterium]
MLKDYRINTDGVLTLYIGDGGDVTIHDGVTSIGDGAFDGCSSLTAVSIPGSVTAVGAGIFRGCDKLPNEKIESCLPENDFWREGRTSFELDGWYGQTYTVFLKGAFASLRFVFRNKYDELGIEDCVYIKADSERVHPVRQADDNFILDLKGVDKLFIKSIRPGKNYVPDSLEITLGEIRFHR